MWEKIRKLAGTLLIVLFISVSNVFPYVIPAGGTHTFVRGVNPGWVTVQIRGNGNSNLDLYVYYGNTLIGASESPYDSEVVQAQTPGGGITIVVVNRGSYANNYQTNF
jgi:hypothetical protein